MSSQGIGSSVCPVRASRPRGAKPGSVLPAGRCAFLPPAPPTVKPSTPDPEPLRKPERAANGRIVSPEGMRWCTGCQDHLPIGDFGRNAAMKDGLQRRCKTCHAAYQASYQESKRRKAS